MKASVILPLLAMVGFLHVVSAQEWYYIAPAWLGCDVGYFACREEFQGGGSQVCIVSSKVCDGVGDCRDIIDGDEEEKRKKRETETEWIGSDEDSCTAGTCQGHWCPIRYDAFLVVDRCIPEEYVCSGTAECANDSDERWCDACMDDPCQNGGTCTSGEWRKSKSYKCTCAEGFYGKNCNKRVGHTETKESTEKEEEIKEKTEEESTTKVITVTHKGKSCRRKRSIDFPRKKRSASAPEIIESVMDQLVMEGKTAIFDAVVEAKKGGEEADIDWYHCNCECVIIQDEGKFQYLFEKDNVVGLRIRHVTPEDAGVYKMVAFNEHGRVEAKAMLSVTSTVETETPKNWTD